jgi:hypothetical protein
MADTQTDIDALLDEVLATSVPLHEAIAAFDEPGARYELAGAPGIAIFTRDGDTISHESSSPAPALADVIEDLRGRHMTAIGAASGTDNSHLPALLLLCVTIVDRAVVERFGLQSVARRAAEVYALDEEEGRHDPELEPGDVALRAWVPLGAAHEPGAGVHSAILEWRFRVERYQRYTP